MRRLIPAGLTVLCLVIFCTSHAKASQSVHAAPAVTTSVDKPVQTGHVRHREVTGHYWVHRGDTLSSIARRVYGHAGSWQALWWKNRAKIADPNVLRIGTKLRLTRWHPDPPAWLARRAASAITPPAPRHTRYVPAPPPAAHHHSRPAPAPAPAPAAASYSGGSGFQHCVIMAESGGNPAAVNPSSGAGGLYGFLPSTWHALGFPGLPEYAPVAEQNAAFAKEYAESGTSAWAPYDGC